MLRADCRNLFVPQSALASHMSKNALPPPNGKENSKPEIFVNHYLTAML
jgi:hypothetical protein